MKRAEPWTPPSRLASQADLFCVSKNTQNAGYDIMCVCVCVCVFPSGRVRSQSTSRKTRTHGSPTPAPPSHSPSELNRICPSTTKAKSTPRTIRKRRRKPLPTRCCISSSSSSSDLDSGVGVGGEVGRVQRAGACVDICFVVKQCLPRRIPCPTCRRDWF